MFSETDFDSHTCDRPLKECRIIEVSEIIDGSYGEKRLMNGWGTDGVLYTFEAVPRKAIPYFIRLSDEKKHLPDSDTEVTVPVFGFCQLFEGWFFLSKIEG
jgi:hypothetical protein